MIEQRINLYQERFHEKRIWFSAGQVAALWLLALMQVVGKDIDLMASLLPVILFVAYRNSTWAYVLAAGCGVLMWARTNDLCTVPMAVL